MTDHEERVTPLDPGEIPADAVWVLRMQLQDQVSFTELHAATYGQQSLRRRFFYRLAGTGPPTARELVLAERARGVVRDLSSRRMDAALVDEHLRVYAFRNYNGEIFPERR